MIKVHLLNGVIGKRPPTCKEGNGIQCSVNLPSSNDVSGGGTPTPS